MYSVHGKQTPGGEDGGTAYTTCNGVSGPLTSSTIYTEESKDGAIILYILTCVRVVCTYQLRTPYRTTLHLERFHMIAASGTGTTC